VKYTLYLSADYPTEDNRLDCVNISAENLDAAATENGLPDWLGWLERLIDGE